MKTIKELLKNILLIGFYAAGAILLLLIAGEADESVTFIQLVLVKFGAILGAYLLLKAAVYSMEHGLIPNWFIEYTKKLTAEED